MLAQLKSWNCKPFPGQWCGQTRWRSRVIALVFLLLPAAHAAPNFPQLTGRVVDQAGLLDPAKEKALSAQLAAHEEATSNQIVVVTLSDLQGYTISDFANQLGRHWQIGQAERNNGVLLVVARNERKVRIEVGYGLEGALTDAVSSDIIRRQIIPQFREGDNQNGILSGVISIIGAIKGEYKVEPRSLREHRKGPLKGFFPLVFIALIALFEILKRLGHRKLGNSAFPTAILGIAITAITNNILYGILAAIVLFIIFYFFIKPSSAGGGGTSTSDRQSRVEHDSRNGNFGGGGGSFGGGGASGSW